MATQLPSVALMPPVKNKLRSRTVFDDAVRHHRAGRLTEAVAGYKQALAATPNYPEAHNNLGAALEDLGRIDEAMAHYQRALALKPDYPDAHNNLGARLAAQGKFREAIAHYQRVVALRPDHAPAHHNLAMALNNLGVLLAAAGKLDEAISHYRRALALRPDLADTYNNLGVALVDRGEIDEALRHYERAITLDPANAEAHYNRAEIRTFRKGDTDFVALEVLAARTDLPEKTKPLPHFALAKVLEDIGEYPRAFEHLRRANELKRRQVPYDEAAVLSFFRRVSTTFDRGLVERLTGGGDPSEGPIFVLGMPRSGSTLLDDAGNKVEFSMITNAGNKSRERMAAMIQQDLKALGIRVTITTLDFPSLIERIFPPSSRQRLWQTAVKFGQRR